MLSRNYNLGRTGKINGILASNLFKDYLFTLDFVKKEILIAKGRLQQNEDDQTIAMQTPYGTPLITINIGPLQLTADIDSSDEMYITAPEWIIHLLPHDSTSHVVGTSQSINNKVLRNRTKVYSFLRVAQYEQGHPTIFFNKVFQNLNIGSQWLKNYAFTFDQVNNLVKLEDYQ